MPSALETGGRLDDVQRVVTGSESDAGAEAESERTGTFLVTVAGKESVVLKNAYSGQTHVLSPNPGVSEDEAARGTVAPNPPMNVSWRLVEVESRWVVSVERSTESPTTNSRDIAADNPDGELARKERAGTGEIHVLLVPDDMTEQVVGDILDDREGLLLRAVRLDVNCVEIRSQSSVVAVHYIP